MTWPAPPALIVTHYEVTLIQLNGVGSGTSHRIWNIVMAPGATVDFPTMPGTLAADDMVVGVQMGVIVDAILQPCWPGIDALNLQQQVTDLEVLSNIEVITP